MLQLVATVRNACNGNSRHTTMLNVYKIAWRSAKNCLVAFKLPFGIFRSYFHTSDLF